MQKNSIFYIISSLTLLVTPLTGHLMTQLRCPPRPSDLEGLSTEEAEPLKPLRVDPWDPGKKGDFHGENDWKMMGA